MPRAPRDDAPGAAHHVMLRGIERRPIFFDDTDRAEFVRRLDRLVPALGFRCFAWALMPNHVHLVVRAGPVSISRLLARLATGYALWLNRRHDRAGHLFQNRFRSRRVVDDADLFGLVLYVTRNPLAAGITPSLGALERFPWCGLGSLVGRRAAHGFEAVAETLALFADEPREARRRLRGWLGDGARCVEPEIRATPAVCPACPVRERAAEPGVRLGELLCVVCAAHEVDPGVLSSPRRSRALDAARAEFALRVSLECGASGAEIARQLGRSRSAVSRLFERERTRHNSTAQRTSPC